MSSPEITIIFVFGTLTLVAFVFFPALINTAYRKKHICRITGELSLKHQYQSQLLLTRLEVQEQSFNYASEEIHDNIAQTLSLVKIKLYQLRGRLKDPDTEKSIENTLELLGKVLDDLRNLSHTLNGGLLSKLSLQESIEQELSYIRATNIKAHLRVSGTSVALHSEKRLLIFRIVQESVNNAVKHGKADEINVHLLHLPGILTVQITDNGKGFDTGATEKNTGLGLYNMHIRAAMLGKLDIQSEKNKGTVITLTIETNEL